MPLGLGPFLDQIVTLILLIVAVLGGIHLYRRNVSAPAATQAQISARAGSTGNQPMPEGILRERYARGEIDRSRYFQMLQNLRAESNSGSFKPTHSVSAEEIAGERYARGEINSAQFHEIMGDLTKDRR